jgi:hypothetical protein
MKRRKEGKAFSFLKRPNALYFFCFLLAISIIQNKNYLIKSNSELISLFDLILMASTIFVPIMMSIIFTQINNIKEDYDKNKSSRDYIGQYSLVDSLKKLSNMRIHIISCFLVIVVCRLMANPEWKDIADIERSIFNNALFVIALTCFMHSIIHSSEYARKHILDIENKILGKKKNEPLSTNKG